MKTKTLTDRNNKELKKGSIIHYQEGWARIKSVSVKAKTVNLCGVFADRITDKNVPLADIYEDEAAWYENWTKSESYMSM